MDKCLDGKCGLKFNESGDDRFSLCVVAKRIG